MKPSISLLNETIWITWGASESVEVSQISDLKRKSDNGKLPDNLSDRQLHQLLNRIHKLRSARTSSRLHCIPGALIGFALVLSVFWLGSGLMYQLQTNPVENTRSTSSDLTLPITGSSCSGGNADGLIPGYDKDLHSSFSKSQNDQRLMAKKIQGELSDVSNEIANGNVGFGYANEKSDAPTQYTFGYEG